MPIYKGNGKQMWSIRLKYCSSGVISRRDKNPNSTGQKATAQFRYLTSPNGS